MLTGADGAVGQVDRTGRGDPDAVDRATGLGERVGDRALSGGPHLFGVVAVRGGLAGLVLQPPVGVDEPGGDLGAADVES